MSAFDILVLVVLIALAAAPLGFFLSTDDEEGLK